MRLHSCDGALTVIRPNDCVPCWPISSSMLSILYHLLKYFVLTDILPDILNIDHAVTIVRNAFSVGMLLSCHLVHVCKLTVELSTTHQYWAEILYFGLGRFSFSLVLVRV